MARDGTNKLTEESEMDNESRKGLYVAVKTCASLCPSTDAVTGSSISKMAEPTTFDAAHDMVDQWHDNNIDEFGYPNCELSYAYVVEYSEDTYPGRLYSAKRSYRMGGE